MGIRREPISDLLSSLGATPEQLSQAREMADKSGSSLLEAASSGGTVTGDTVAKAVAATLGIDILEEVDVEKIDVDLVRPLPLGLSRENGVLPLWKRSGAVIVGISSPSALPALDDLRVLYGQPIAFVALSPGLLRDATNKAYDKASQTAEAVMEELDEHEGDLAGDLQLGEDLLDDPNQAPIIRFVNSLFTQAVKERASDIHIEPFEKELAVRFRVDGVLYEVVKPPKRLKASIVSRVKIMAGLNIAENGFLKTAVYGHGWPDVKSMCA